MYVGWFRRFVHIGLWLSRQAALVSIVRFGRVAPHCIKRREERTSDTLLMRLCANPLNLMCRPFEPLRRHATLTALALDLTATLTDEALKMFEHLVGKLFKKSERVHAEQFHASGKSINEKVRLYVQVGQALIEARSRGGDAFAAIEAVMCHGPNLNRPSPRRRPLPSQRDLTILRFLMTAAAACASSRLCCLSILSSTPRLSLAKISSGAILLCFL